MEEIEYQTCLHHVLIPINIKTISNDNITKEQHTVDGILCGRIFHPSYGCSCSSSRSSSIKPLTSLKVKEIWLSLSTLLGREVLIY